MCWNNHDILKILFRDKSKVNVQQYSAIIHQLPCCLHVRLHVAVPSNVRAGTVGIVRFLVPVLTCYEDKGWAKQNKSIYNNVCCISYDS